MDVEVVGCWVASMAVSLAVKKVLKRVEKRVEMTVELRDVYLVENSVVRMAAKMVLKLAV